MKRTAFVPHEGIYIQNLKTNRKNNMPVQHYHDAYEIYLQLDAGLSALQYGAFVQMLAENLNGAVGLVADKKGGIFYEGREVGEGYIQRLCIPVR